MTDTVEALKPCPFCGSGLTFIHVNKGTWTGNGYGEPISVEVRHWCEKEDGQPERMISRIGRDRESAITAWNRRAIPDTHVVVPREPTPEMVAAGNDASAWHVRDADDIYRAMIDAAAPSAEQKEE